MNYLDTSNRSLKAEMDQRYRQAQPLQQQWWYEANQDLKLTVGQQDYYNQLFSANFRNQRTLQFNKLMRIINMIGGYQRKNRHTSTCIPIENSDNHTADQLTALMMWSMNRDDTYEKISDTFDGSNITGLNLMNVWMDYREDPENGDIRTTRVPYSAFIMDPYWKEPDLSDCEWIWQRRYLSKSQIVALVPDAKNDPTLKRPPSNQTSDGRFLYLPENRQTYNSSFYAYDEYWTREYKTVEKFFDKRTGEVVDIPKKMDEDRLNLFMRVNPSIEIIKAQKPTCKLNILVNDNEIWEETEPYGIEEYPYIPFLCYHYPEVEDYSWRYVGVPRNLRDSQVELNKRRNKFFDLLDSQINSGIIAKEDALVDPEDAFLSGQGRVLFLKETASMDDVREVTPPNIPQSWFELTKVLDEEIMSIAGATEELFGETDKSDTSGFMMQLRMGAGLTSLQNIFDRLRQSQRNLGTLFIKLMQANFSEGKVRRILNEDPSEQFGDTGFQKYDCEVAEGILTSTQRQMQFVQLLQLRGLEVPIPTKFLLEASTLQKKDELIAAIEEIEQQEAQVRQAQQIQELEQQALVTRSIEAKAQNDFASARERDGRTISNIGLYSERESEKLKNESQAVLDQVRAIKELAAMDDDQLMKRVQFVVNLQQLQKDMSSGVDLEGIAAADVVGKDIDLAKQQTEIPQKNKSSNDLQQRASKLSLI